MLLAIASGADAQIAMEDPDWQETALAAPPPFSTDQLLPLDMPPYVTLRLGIDPTTLTITADGVVRYVVVARNSSGSVSAFYEGIRCARSEVKTYARSSNTTAWTLIAEARWRDLSSNQPSKHAIVFSRQAACVGATAANSTADIIRAMKK